MLDEDDSETFDFEELLEKMTADEERLVDLLLWSSFVYNETNI